jgi:ribosomal-protein-alanine N-acetyltransferase
MNPDNLGDQLPTLQGDGLLLRWLIPPDATAIFELFGDPDVLRFTAVPPLETPADADRFIAEAREDFERGREYQWGIELEGEIVGTCKLYEVDRQHRRAGLGFAIVKRMWGRRVVSRAIPAVLDFAFERLGLHRVEADADPRNEGSLRALRRFGFREEGVLRERYFQFGEAQDAVMFGLLRREWRVSSQGPQ